MRRLGLLALFLVLALTAAPVRADDPSLELRWHFDKTAGYDSSGNGWHSFPISPVAGGKFDNAVTGGATIGNPPGKNRYDFPDFQRVTVMVWVRSLGVPTGANPAYLASDGGNGDGCDPSGPVAYGLIVATDGTLRFGTNTSNPNNFSPAAPGLQLWDGLWHAVAGVYGNDGKARLYVDGAQIGDGTPAGPPSGFSEPFTVGGYPGACSRPYFGDVDEARVYSRALDSGEIGWLQTSPAAPYPRILPQPPAPQNVTLRHPLDVNPPGGSTADTSGNGLDGTDVLGPTVTGRFGSALNGNYVVGDNPVLKPQSFSVTAWVKSTAPGAFHTIVGSGGGTCSGQTWALRTDGNSQPAVLRPDAHGQRPPDRRGHQRRLRPVGQPVARRDGDLHRRRRRAVRGRRRPRDGGVRARATASRRSTTATSPSSGWASAATRSRAARSAPSTARSTRSGSTTGSSRRREIIALHDPIGDHPAAGPGPDPDAHAVPDAVALAQPLAEPDPDRDADARGHPRARARPEAQVAPQRPGGQQLRQGLRLLRQRARRRHHRRRAHRARPVPRRPGDPRRGRPGAARRRRAGRQRAARAEQPHGRGLGAAGRDVRPQRR